VHETVLELFISFDLVYFRHTLMVLMHVYFCFTVVVRGLPSSASWQDLKVWNFYIKK